MAISRICSIPNCGKRVYARALCNGHYKQAHKSAPHLLAPLAHRQTICSIPGCGMPFRCKGMCKAHYAASCYAKWSADETRERCAVDGCDKPRLRGKYCHGHGYRNQSHGDPLAGIAPKGAQLLFVEKLLTDERTQDCIPWPFGSTVKKNRYGNIRINGKSESAPRYVCERRHGLAPSRRHQVCHSCRNKTCVNPEHLRWGTPKENGQDKVAHGTSVKGEKQHSAKLTTTDVLAIRNEPIDISHVELAKKYGVSDAAIAGIRKRRTWRHI